MKLVAALGQVVFNFDLISFIFGFILFLFYILLSLAFILKRKMRNKSKFKKK